MAGPDESFERLVREHLSGKDFISVGQRMAGIGVKGTIQGFRRKVWDSTLLKPGSGPLPNFSVCRAIFCRHDVFIEGPDKDEDIIVPVSECFNDLPKPPPLERMREIDPIKLRRSLPGF